MTRRLSLVAALLAALALVVAGCSSSSGPSSAKSSQLAPNQGTGTFDGTGLTPAQPRPSFTLTDTAGKPYSFSAETAKKPTLLYFGYTNCPDVCPTTMQDITDALKKVPASVAKQTQVVFVSTDVKRDTTAVIHRWLSNFSAGSRGTWIGLRGTQQQIDAAQAAAHVTLAEDDGQTHSAQVLLYGPDDYAHVSYLQSSNESTSIAHDLPLVARGVTGN